MQKETKKKTVVFFSGLTIVTFLTVIGSFAFFSVDLLAAVRNVFITDVAFVILYVVWIKLHKGYEQIYKSGLELEGKK